MSVDYTSHDFGFKDNLKNIIDLNFKGQISSVEEGIELAKVFKKIDFTLYPILFLNEQEYIQAELFNYKESIDREKKEKFVIPIAFGAFTFCVIRLIYIHF